MFQSQRLLCTVTQVQLMQFNGCTPETPIFRTLHRTLQDSYGTSPKRFFSEFRTLNFEAVRTLEHSFWPYTEQMILQNTPNFVLSEQFEQPMWVE